MKKSILSLALILTIIASFIIPAIPVLAVTPPTISIISETPTDTTCTIIGNVGTMGSSSSISIKAYYYYESNPQIQSTAVDITATGDFEIDLTDLIHSTTYYFVLQGTTNDSQYIYSSYASFTTSTPSSGPTSLDISITNVLDNASTDLSYPWSDETYLFNGSSHDWLSWIRFANITIPQGATITTAYLQTSHWESQVAPEAYIQLTDNATRLTSRSEFLSATFDSTGYSLTDSGTTNKISVSLVSIIQSTVNQTGWNSGNAISFKIDDPSNSTSNASLCDSYLSSGGTPPILHIEYTNTSIPSVSTSDATQITSTSATLNGTATSTGSDATAVEGFFWGTTTSYGHTVYATMNRIGNFTVNIQGLTPNTTYHFKAFATNTVGASYGEDFTVSTTGIQRLPATIYTSPADNITNTTVYLNGNLEDTGTSTNIVVGFEYGPTTSYGTYITARTMSTTGFFNLEITGLTPGTTYHFLTVASNGYGVSNGSDEQFTTLSGTTTTATGQNPPVVFTANAINVTGTSATLTGNLADTGNVSSVVLSFAYGTTTDYGDFSDTTTLNSTGAFSIQITGLSPNTVYHFEAIANNGIGPSSTGHDFSFQTKSTTTTTTTTPTLLTLQPINISADSATFQGTLSGIVIPQIADCGFSYGKDTNYGEITSLQSLGTPQTYTCTVTDLKPNTVYHVMAIAIFGNSNILSNDVTFTTSPNLTITCSKAYMIQTDSAAIDISLISMGIEDTADIYIIFDQNYALDSKNGTKTKIESNVSKPQTFKEISITSLVTATIYYYRVEAKGNSGQIYYSSEHSFATYDPTRAGIINKIDQWFGTKGWPQATWWIILLALFALTFGLLHSHLKTAIFICLIEFGAFIAFSLLNTYILALIIIIAALGIGAGLWKLIKG